MSDYLYDRVDKCKSCNIDVKERLLTKRNGLCYKCYIKIVNTQIKKCPKCNKEISFGVLKRNKNMCSSCNKKGKINIAQLLCYICVKEWDNKLDIIRLPKCGHHFHMDCFQQLNKKICPICNKEVGLIIH